MTATITKLPFIPTRTTNRIKRQWDKLEGRGNALDFERAKLLNEVWNRLQQDDKSLAGFLVNVLDIYKGKRTLAFIRLAHAFDAIDDVDTWTKLGGKSVVILSRVKHKTKRRAIMRRVDKTLKRTGRSTVAVATFRTFAHEVLGDENYRKALTEPHGRSNLTAELALLKQFILTMIGTNPELEKAMSPAVKKALGLDLLRRKQA